MSRNYLTQGRQLFDRDIRKAFSDLSIDTVRFTNTYPDATGDPGQRGDFAFKSDGSKMAIHTGEQWKSITLSDTL